METIRFNKTLCGVDFLLNVVDSADLSKFESPSGSYNSDFFEIIFIEEGRGTLWLGQQKIELSPNTIVFVSPFQKRKWESQRSQLKLKFLIFQEAFLNEFFADQYFTFRLLYFYQTELPLQIKVNAHIFTNALEQLKEIKNEIKNPKTDSIHIIRSLLYYQLMKLNRNYAEQHQLILCDPQNNYAYQFRKLIESNIQKLHRIDEYTELLGINRITLNKAVKAQFNVTASELIKNRLIFEIKTLLINTEKTVQEIASQLNFSEPNHLTRLFKSKENCTPTQYRNMHQNGS